MLLLLLLLSLVGGTGSGTSVAIHGLADLHGSLLGLIDGLAELGCVSMGEVLVLVEVLEGVDLALDLLDLLGRELGAELVELLLGVEVGVLGLVA